MQPIQPDSGLPGGMPAPESRMGKSPLVARERRITKDGRQLWYQLEVLQQPERARACGSGPKSSADRRPVDPPPVVILKVWEGETFEGARDITFDYNVDFFCYASLEHARPMAHGRVQTPAATSPPVLTGFPVSGCCYLDRPDPAGYFLFPDLSVRHEGRYRLVFSLYELIKNEGDLDRDAPEPESGAVQLPSDACHRMDLRSADFTVFSAKKFPGLTESTTLSRTVAEQGCRVRIRRDVRMRRRDTNVKPAGADEYSNNAEDEYTKRRATRTPDGYRDRSMSNSSIDRTSFADRRTSNVDYATAPPPPTYQSNKSSGALLNFGQSTNSFVQPSYGSISASNPQSTPVSPAQTVFPPAQNVNLPPPSPSYSSSGYATYEQAEAENNKRLSTSYPLISAKPPRCPEPRSSISSNISMESTPRPILPSISFPCPSDPSAYPDYGSYSVKGARGLYPQLESRQVKRSADETFSSQQQQMRDVRGDRLPMQPIYPLTSSYTRADGKRAFAPDHLWLK